MRPACLRPDEHARYGHDRREAQRRTARAKRGFETYVGGGLGAVPYQAKLFDPFITPEELLPTAQAIARVFAKYGEKKNRSRARIKFLVQDLGIEKFRELVLRGTRKPASRSSLDGICRRGAPEFKESPLKPAGERPLLGSEVPALDQDQYPRAEANGYAVVTIALPLGDITANQLRALADIARQFTKETIRTTVEQNIVLRWISDSDLRGTLQGAGCAGLAQPGAETIVDIVTCPGTDTCKLGISSSRGLGGGTAQELGRKELSIGSGRARTCTSRSAAASIVAASIMSRTWASTA